MCIRDRGEGEDEGEGEGEGEGDGRARARARVRVRVVVGLVSSTESRSCIQRWPLLKVSLRLVQSYSLMIRSMPSRSRVAPTTFSGKLKAAAHAEREAKRLQREAEAEREKGLRHMLKLRSRAEEAQG